MSKLTELFISVTNKVLDYIDNNKNSWIDDYMAGSEEEINTEIDKLLEGEVNNEENNETV